jgi:hypothetical protein
MSTLQAVRPKRLHGDVPVSRCGDIPQRRDRRVSRLLLSACGDDRQIVLAAYNTDDDCWGFADVAPHVDERRCTMDLSRATRNDIGARETHYSLLLQQRAIRVAHHEQLL